ncbi:hypothetical protein D9615_005742 [Tricholomella constricta]|uniref:non-specific serine/threonine protein kinase n=1 Tax=Tricholomella constricta TaxID=117010 RepID=A0A8H5HB15_9AGAR|nr:hypothetical protein D9615_005742 [Tricholomella constricta]
MAPVPIPHPPDPIYLWQEDVEDLEQYSSGGYYPVHIDDEIQGRYRIVHKLGYGGYSTVWLARDQQESRFVALKFIVASASGESPEIRILRHLGTTNTSHPGRQYIANLLDDFEVQSPNGIHRCLVTEVAGPSVGKIRFEISGNKLPVPVARKVASQCAQGLAFLHSSGVVHGDIHPGNILFSIPDFHSWPVEKVYKHFGKPYKEPVERLDGQPLTSAAPRYVVLSPNPLRLAKLVMNTECNIKITDFGESFLKTEPPKSLNTPTAYAAPEILFSDIISPKVDVWALACTIYEVLGNHKLLESFFMEIDEVLVEMVRTFGKLPERWWKQWENRPTFFEEDGSFKPNSGDLTGESRTVDLKERLVDIRRDDEEGQKELSRDLDALEVVLEKMLRYEPDDRIGIEDIELPF